MNTFKAPAFKDAFTWPGRKRETGTAIRLFGSSGETFLYVFRTGYMIMVSASSDQLPLNS